MMQRLLAVLLACISLGLAGCSTSEFVRGLGQTLYNSGRYVCTQSHNCDAGVENPADSGNRR